MYAIRHSNQRGHFNHGWLESYHTFSFADYYDPEHMGFRVLRVINEDIVQPQKGFGKHPHKNMEIITYVIEGELEHKDSMGNGSIIRAGDLQYMTAGTGVHHSEFNPSSTQAVHLYQIWILPLKDGLQPAYQQKSLEGKLLQNKLNLLASPEGEADSMKINQDVRLYLGEFSSLTSVEKQLNPERYYWLQVISGELMLKSETLSAGDGVSFSEDEKLELDISEKARLLLFDLP